MGLGLPELSKRLKARERGGEKSLRWVPKLEGHIVFSSKDNNHAWLAEADSGLAGTRTPTLQCMVISRLEARQTSQYKKRC